MRPPQYEPGNHDISFGHLPFNRHNQIRVTVTKGKHMVAESLDPYYFGMRRHELRCQEFRETIHRAGVRYLLQ
jgi:hypothetical protein